MNEEEILKKMNNDKDYRAKTLINLNVALQRTQRNVARVEDLQEIKEFKIAVVSLENENNELQQENQELKLELSGYRQAILNNKEMLGLKEQNQKQKEVIDKLNELLSDEFLEVIDREILLDILKEVSE